MGGEGCRWEFEGWGEYETIVGGEETFGGVSGGEAGMGGRLNQR